MTRLPDRPTDWPSLLAFLQADPGMTVHGFTYFMDALGDKTPTDIGFGVDLGRVADVLSRGLVMGQGDQMAKALTLLRERADVIAQGDDTLMSALPANCQAVLACAVVSDLAGHGDWRDLVDQALTRLWSRPVNQDRFGMQTVWASLAWGDVESVNRVIKSNDKMDFNGPFNDQWDVLRQIAVTIRDGDPLEQALPAWQHWLKRFPKTLNARDTSWNDLLWAARAVHCVIGGAAPKDVLARLRNDIDAV